MFKILPRFLTLVIPIATIYLFITYHDPFYLILTIISFIFVLILLIPKLLSDKKIKFGGKKEITEIEQVVEEFVETNPYLNIKKSKLPKRIYFCLFVILLVFFFAIAIFFLPDYAINNNPILTYYLSSLIFYKDSWIVYSAVFVICIPIFIFWLTKFKLKNYTRKSYITSVLIYFVIILITYILSLPLYLTYGLINLNITVLNIKNDPKSINLITNKDEVVNKIKSTSTLPKILIENQNLDELALHYVFDKDPGGTFYKKNIFKIVPSNLVLKSNVPTQPVLFIGDDLIITSVDRDEMEAISPSLAKLLVKNYFNDRFIKDVPKIQVMGRQEYLKFREDDINNRIAKVDELINAADKIIGQIYSNIQNDKNKIAVNQSGLSQSISSRDSAYNYCVSAGYTDYYTGLTYNYYSQQQCDSQKDQWNQTIAGFQKNISDWQAALKSDQSDLPQYQDAKTLFTNLKALLAAQKDSTPGELGLFEPDNSIKIALDTTNSKGTVSYLQTLTHEYLHYTSYVSTERSLPQFFEEGITEYYAREAIKKDLNIDTNIGYPVVVKIIKQLVSKIPPEQLKDIYFNKDESQLQGTLDNLYGKDFYKNSQYYFSAIFYAPPDDAIKFGNNIMFKIGGSEIKKDDLYSTY